MMTIKENYLRWLNSPNVDEKTKQQLKEMDEKAIADAFFKDAEFGTAGMRGVLGPGTNRLNVYTIKRVAVGFALYLLKLYPNAKNAGVVISHDNRHMSREFTLLSAEILNDFGIKSYIFDSLRPTPELSFAVRYLKAVGGIMVTASHNPKEYNGYKVYDENGCQLVPEKIKGLLKIIDTLPKDVDVTYEKVTNRGENIILDNEVDDAYVKEVEALALNKDLPKDNFKIVYTPNHGTSYVNAMRIFKDFGYDIHPVLSQCDPDPDFSGTLSPNPEDPRSFIEPLKLAEQIGAKLVVMTDPDGDRVGMGYLASDGSYKTFTGNQSAAILMDYIFSEKQKRGLLSKNGVMYNTIVTSSLGEKVAASYGIKTEQFLTGFKFIGDRIDYYEKNGGPTFEFGYEESYGCLVAPFARDKDGLQAILLYTEMALFYDLQGKTLDIVWDELNQKHGYHQDIAFGIDFKGPEGQEKMDTLMQKLHVEPLKELDGAKVIKVEDYLKQVRYENNKESKIDLPKSDVVKLYFDNGNTISIRPSGTEPKVRFYFGVISKSKPINDDNVKKLYEKLKSALDI